MARWRLYTDGSSHARGQKPGGWAWLLLRVEADQVKPVKAQSGGDPITSNNRMELSGIMMGLGYIASAGCEVGIEDGDELEIVSDSQYALNMSAGKWNPSSNQELIWHIQRDLKRLVGHITVTFSWTPGHAGEIWNERVDRMATAAKVKVMKDLTEAFHGA